MEQLPNLLQSEIQGQIKLNGKNFPIVYGPQKNSARNFIFLQQYFSKYKEQILAKLSEQGAIYFRGFDIKSPTEMATILNSLGISSFQYIGGAAVRKLIVGSEKRLQDQTQIFTTNESPPQEPIPFHNQLMQNSFYPEYLSFYCYREAQEGGSTPLASGQYLYQFIKQKHPGFLQTLENLKLRYIRVVGKQDNPDSPIGRGWKNIFKCQTKQEVQLKMKEKGYEWEWLNNEDEDIRLISQPLPGVRTSKSGKKVFCNQFAVFKGWVDKKNQPSQALRFGDFSEIPLEPLQSIYQQSYKTRAAISWKVGDFVLIDNQMVMHSRQPFKGANRKIYASLFRGKKANIRNDLRLTLKSGDEMPMIGFGTWKIPKQIAEQTIYQAIKSGYRLIDCAGVYGNEKQVGKGINRAIFQEIITRKDLFITSKLWNTFHRPQHVKAACQRTLSDLGLEYLDLYLIHWPIALKYVDPNVAYPTVFKYVPTPTQGPEVILDKVPIIDTWRAMEELVDSGLTRNLGVSNFNVSLLRDLINGSRIFPSVNQVEVHPYLTQKNLIRFCQQSGVQVTSYSTMGGSSYVDLKMANAQDLIIQTQIIKELAKKYQRTEAQVILRWAVQQGLAIIPKTSKVERLKQNSDLSGWSIEESDIKRIDSLNCNKRFCDTQKFLEEKHHLQVICWE